MGEGGSLLNLLEIAERLSVVGFFIAAFYLLITDRLITGGRFRDQVEARKRAERRSEELQQDLTKIAKETASLAHVIDGMNNNIERIIDRLWKA